MRIWKTQPTKWPVPYQICTRKENALPQFVPLLIKLGDIHHQIILLYFEVEFKTNISTDANSGE